MVTHGASFAVCPQHTLVPLRRPRRTGYAAPAAVEGRTCPPTIHDAEVFLPELPDIVVYLEALAPRVLNQRLERLRIANPFLVRTPEPPVSAVEGRRVLALRRLGKRIVFALEDDLFLVLHLMIAGRLRWKERGAPIPGKVGLAAFDFPAGTAILTEAGSKRQASLHLVEGAGGLSALDPGGLEVLESDLPAFAERLTRVNHTLKRALTDPHIFSGIGNAYSDEILHAARLSPLQLTAHLSGEQIARLHESTVRTLERWIAQLRDELGDAFPDRVTAFRPEMAVHGKYRQPCPVCGDPVQRIVYARNESNYCATCQTGGRLLSDRALARLLRDDWPRTLEEMERRMRGKQEERRSEDS
jgi:formamidopyrimidine-DNA glycosylase